MVFHFDTIDGVNELEMERVLACKTKNMVYSVKHEDNIYVLKLANDRDLSLLLNEYQILRKIHDLAEETGISDLQISTCHKYGSIKGKSAILLGPLGKPFSYPKTFSELMDIVVQLAETLRKLHQLGYVHAGIRSGNLIIVDEKVFLIDFERSVKIGKFLLGARADLETPFYVEYGVAYVSEDWFQLMFFIFVFFDADYKIQSKKHCSKSMFPDHPNLQEVYDYLLENHKNVDDDKVVSMLQKVVATQSKL